MIASVLAQRGVLDGVCQGQARYAEFTDYEIVHRAQCGVESAAEYLLYKYRHLVRAKATSYFLIGAEKEDLLQVGMIGLWQAVIDFRPDRAISFPAFAKVCITRHIITAIKGANRMKQTPLNSSLSLEGPAGCDPDWNLADVLPTGPVCDPEEQVLQREDTRLLHDTVQRVLSDFEWLVLSRYRLGKSYREIAIEFGCNTKSIDNALARIKRKLASVPLGQADLTRLTTV